MMTRVAGLIQLLKGHYGSEIKGIGPGPVPESALKPYVTVQLVTGTETESHDGLSGLSRVFMQVNVWHETYETAALLRDSIKAYLCGFNGSTTTGGPVIAGVNRPVDKDLHAGPTELHQCLVRLEVWWDNG
jgi:hypothetical protein